jgi:large subunit ribosomal protein L3
VTQVKLPETDGYCALQLGAGERKLKRLTKAQIGHFASSGVVPKQVLREFRVTPDAVMPTGTSFSVHHFIVGQYLDITGISKGKGFAGLFVYVHSIHRLLLSLSA